MPARSANGAARYNTDMRTYLTGEPAEEPERQPAATGRSFEPRIPTPQQEGRLPPLPLETLYLEFRWAEAEAEARRVRRAPAMADLKRMMLALHEAPRIPVTLDKRSTALGELLATSVQQVIIPSGVTLVLMALMGVMCYRQPVLAKQITLVIAALLSLGWTGYVAWRSLSRLRADVILPLYAPYKRRLMPKVLLAWGISLIVPVRLPLGLFHAQIYAAVFYLAARAEGMGAGWAWLMAPSAALLQLAWTAWIARVWILSNWLGERYNGWLHTDEVWRRIAEGRIRDVLRDAVEQLQADHATEAQQAVCNTCLCRFRRTEVWPPAVDIVVYHCPVCERLYHPDYALDGVQILAVVLDADGPDRWELSDGVLRVPFELMPPRMQVDRIEIGRATDAQIERLVLHLQEAYDPLPPVQIHYLPNANPTPHARNVLASLG